MRCMVTESIEITLTKCVFHFSTTTRTATTTNYFRYIFSYQLCLPFKDVLRQLQSYKCESFICCCSLHSNNSSSAEIIPTKFHYRWCIVADEFELRYFYNIQFNETDKLSRKTTVCIIYQMENTVSDFICETFVSCIFSVTISRHFSGQYR